MLVAFCSFTSAEEFEDNGIKYNIIRKTKTAEVIENGYKGNIVIPPSIKQDGVTYDVTSIGSSAFSDCSGLFSVIIPDGITSIGSCAFLRCRNLTSITIPSSITSIGNYAFSGCTSLSSVQISNLTAWCGISFSNSESNPLLSAHHLFLNGTEIENMIIPSSVTSIKD